MTVSPGTYHILDLPSVHVLRPTQFNGAGLQGATNGNTGNTGTSNSLPKFAQSGSGDNDFAAGARDWQIDPSWPVSLELSCPVTHHVTQRGTDVMRSSSSPATRRFIGPQPKTSHLL